MNVKSELICNCPGETVSASSVTRGLTARAITAGPTNQSAITNQAGNLPVIYKVTPCSLTAATPKYLKIAVT
jgi:hypothetical protein